MSRKDDPRILIIEDDADLVEAMKLMLRNRGYNVTTAYDPDEGWKKLGSEKPDLIILDVMFGDKGESKGFDFAQKLRGEKAFSGIPVIMLTAINTVKPMFGFSPETDGEYLPVDAFIDKPVNSEELFTKVSELLNLKSSIWKEWPEKSR